MEEELTEMLRWANRLGHQLPGLRTAEPTFFIVIGLAGVLLTVLLLVASKNRKAGMIIAICSSCVWTGFCGLTLLDNMYAVSFVGLPSPARQHFMQVTLPAYYVVGCLVVWTTYVLAGSFWSRQGARGNVQGT